MFRYILALASASAFLFTLHVNDGRAGERLSATQIVSLFPGTFEAVYEDNTVIAITAHADGRLSGRIGILSDTGRWVIDGNRICIRWDNWLDGKLSCRYVEYANGWYRAVKANGDSRLRLRRAS